uniref:C-type lectin domain-containing protein n=1 Tax=Myripristis murdjan TaxID=586833 RepID=A0A667WHX7_9TELE
METVSLQPHGWIHREKSLSTLMSCCYVPIQNNLSSAHGECAQGWRPYEGRCYYFSTDTKTWSEILQAELVSIHSRAEVEFIRNLNYTKSHHIWIGLTRNHNCKFMGWTWTDKTSLGFLNWAAGEPNEAFHPGEVPENCVEMYHDGHWNDNDCMYKKSFACRMHQSKPTFNGSADSVELL